MRKIALLGDSIFDNQAYTKPGESVADCLIRELGSLAEPVLLAVDGSVTKQVIDQVEKISTETAHIFISSGGNDGLGAKTLLNGVIPIDTAKKQSKLLQNLSSVQGAYDVLAVIQQEFRHVYKRLLNKVSETRIPVTVCTIYDKNPTMLPWHRSALAVFNDVITYEALKIGASIIDLRAVCEEEGDYSEISPIEPSGQGSMKIAAVIKRVLEDEGKGGSGCVRIYK